MNYYLKYLKYKSKYKSKFIINGGTTVFPLNFKKNIPIGDSEINSSNCGPISCYLLGLFNHDQAKKLSEEIKNIGIPAYDLIYLYKKLSNDPGQYIERQLFIEDFNKYWQFYAKNLLKNNLSDGIFMSIGCNFIPIDPDDRGSKFIKHFVILSKWENDPYIIDKQKIFTNKTICYWKFDEYFKWMINIYNKNDKYEVVIKLSFIEDKDDQFFSLHINGFDKYIFKDMDQIAIGEDLYKKLFMPLSQVNETDE
jgi:hypothetical protein